MEFKIENLNLKKYKSNCIVLPVFEYLNLSQITKKINKISGEYVLSLLKREKFKGKIGQSIILYYIPNIVFSHILIVGCGKKEILNKYGYNQICKKIVKSLYNINCKEFVIFLDEFNVKDYNNYWKIRFFIENINEILYSFNKMKSKKIVSNFYFNKVIFNIKNEKDIKKLEVAIQHGNVISLSIKKAKDLANMPPNICNSNYLAQEVLKLKNYSEKLNIEIIDEEKMKVLGMNAYLSVGMGSINKSLMLIINYQGINKTKSKPFVLIGKGLTFDSGGISIKPSNNMDKMKYDMCGAACIYGVMLFICKLNLPINVIGILSCCENMPDGKSYRPGDIIQTMSGKTVEIINTDAEGRLVLCDTLTYVKKFNPRLVIDIATLTGGCSVALGNNYNGLMSNNKKLVKELLYSSQQTGDKTWELPLDSDFHEQLKSDFADIKNSAGIIGSTITAACFLENFAKEYIWAHLDIAGTAWKSKHSGATGRPVSLIAQFLLNQCIKEKNFNN